MFKVSNSHELKFWLQIHVKTIDHKQKEIIQSEKDLSKMSSNYYDLCICDKIQEYRDLRLDNCIIWSTIYYSRNKNHVKLFYEQVEQICYLVDATQLLYLFLSYSCSPLLVSSVLLKQSRKECKHKPHTSLLWQG